MIGSLMGIEEIMSNYDELSPDEKIEHLDE